MQLKAIYINDKEDFVAGETVELEFILVNDDNTVITDFDAYTLKFEIENDSGDVRLDNGARGGVVGASGGTITVTIPATDTAGFDEGYYNIELEVIVDSKTYTACRDKIYFIEELIDWT